MIELSPYLFNREGDWAGQFVFYGAFKGSWALTRYNFYVGVVDDVRLFRKCGVDDRISLYTIEYWSFPQRCVSDDAREHFFNSWHRFSDVHHLSCEVHLEPKT